MAHVDSTPHGNHDDHPLAAVFTTTAKNFTADIDDAAQFTYNKFSQVQYGDDSILHRPVQHALYSEDPDSTVLSDGRDRFVSESATGGDHNTIFTGQQDYKLVSKSPEITYIWDVNRQAVPSDHFNTTKSTNIDSYDLFHNDVLGG